MFDFSKVLIYGTPEFYAFMVYLLITIYIAAAAIMYKILINMLIPPFFPRFHRTIIAMLDDAKGRIKFFTLDDTKNSAFRYNKGIYFLPRIALPDENRSTNASLIIYHSAYASPLYSLGVEEKDISELIDLAVDPKAKIQGLKKFSYWIPMRFMIAKNWLLTINIKDKLFTLEAKKKSKRHGYWKYSMFSSFDVKIVNAKITNTVNTDTNTSNTEELIEGLVEMQQGDEIALVPSMKASNAQVLGIGKKDDTNEYEHGYEYEFTKMPQYLKIYPTANPRFIYNTFIQTQKFIKDLPKYFTSVLNRLIIPITLLVIGLIFILAILNNPDIIHQFFNGK